MSKRGGSSGGGVGLYVQTPSLLFRFAELRAALPFDISIFSYAPDIVQPPL